MIKDSENNARVCMNRWKQKHRYMHYYNSTAHLYNIRYTKEQNLKIKVAMENLKPRGQHSILDLGCGTGLLFPQMQKIVKNIIGLDISKCMLKEIEPCIKGSANVHLILADADHTPFRNSCFDIVFAITLLQNMPNPYCTLQEIKYIAGSKASIIVTGLKKCFTERSFLRLLKRAKLNTKLLKAEQNLKCYVATCQK